MLLASFFHFFSMFNTSKKTLKKPLVVCFVANKIKCIQSHQDFSYNSYGNVIFTHDMEKHRDRVVDYIKSQEILSCGRFGEWDYLWSDQSFLSGKNIANLI